MSMFAKRRKELLDRMPENSVLVLFSGKAKICSEDECFHFTANRNFFYLTGINQENSVLMLIKCIGDRKEYLFAEEYSELKEKWTGKILDFEIIRKTSELDNVQSINTFDTMLDLALKEKDNVYGQINTIFLDLSPELKVSECQSTREYAKLLQSKYPSLTVNDLKPLLTRMRMVKDKEEIDNLYEAIHLTNLGLADLILHLNSGMKESELFDRFEMYGRSHDRHPLAFSTIVATGINGVILHHPVEQQTDRINEGELVEFDLGFKHNGYCADVTRTYPVSGVFNELQRKIYGAVLECNKAVIAYAKPGLTLQNLQEFASLNLKQSCVRLGLMSEDEDIRKYYYHNVSHHLGLDTHDVADRSLPLEAGNVITVEPGLYFKQYKIGIRIEDDVLITENGSLVLTSEIKKEINDIEKIFRGRK